MAKLKGPLLSIDATGHIGKVFAVSHWKGINKGMRHFTPQNPKTWLQQDNRGIFAYAIQSWQSLTNDQKWSYNQSAKNLGLKMSGYNYYLQTYIAAYAVPPPPPGIVTDGLVSWWKFDEDGGGIAYDSWGVYNGTLHGPNWVPGKSNSALNFNGNSDYIDVEGSGGVDLAQYTIECWFKPSIINDWRMIVAKLTDPGSVNNFELRYYTGGKVQLAASGGAGPTTPTGVISIGTWAHLLATFDGTNGRVYIDTILKAGPSGMSVDFVPETIYIGTRDGFYNYAAGIIDEVRIYNRPLTQEEIEQNYNVDA